MAYRILFFLSSTVFTLFFVALQPRLQSVYIMPFKYQTLIDSLNISSDCPDSSAAEIDILAYRWSHNPITHQWNFLPNIPYDIVRNIPPRLLVGEQNCAPCGLSFFTSEKRARDKFFTYKQYLERKYSHLTERYTHIAIGQIKKIDGKATTINNEHFGFYEYDTCDFKKTFKLIATPL